MIEGIRLLGYIWLTLHCLCKIAFVKMLSTFCLHIHNPQMMLQNTAADASCSPVGVLSATVAIVLKGTLTYHITELLMIKLCSKIWSPEVSKAKLPL